MSKEYIEREATIAALKQLPFQWDVEDLAVYEAIEEVPAADVAPVVHGEWKIINTFNNGTAKELQCSACGCKAIFGKVTIKFCPNCGARMDGGNSNES